MTDAFKVVRDFKQALCDYTGAKYAVTTTSCTMALLLSVRWHLQKNQGNQALEQRDPVADHPPVELELRLAGAAQAHHAAGRGAAAAGE